jgi:hypothetical protein
MQTQTEQKPMLLTEVHARAVLATQNMKRDEVWVGAQFA